MQNISSEFEGLLNEMMPKKHFINQEISYINFDGKMNLSTVSHYMKEFLSMMEIENKKCYVYYNTKTPNEVVSDKLIMSLDGLNSPNSPRQIDHPNY